MNSVTTNYRKKHPGSTPRKVAKISSAEYYWCFLGASYLVQLQYVVIAAVEGSTQEAPMGATWVLPRKFSQSYNGREFKPNMQLVLPGCFLLFHH